MTSARRTPYRSSASLVYLLRLSVWTALSGAAVGAIAPTRHKHTQQETDRQTDKQADSRMDLLIHTRRRSGTDLTSVHSWLLTNESTQNQTRRHSTSCTSSMESYIAAGFHASSHTDMTPAANQFDSTDDDAHHYKCIEIPRQWHEITTTDQRINAVKSQRNGPTNHGIRSLRVRYIWPLWENT